MTTVRRALTFLCALTLVAGACSWQTPPLARTTPGPLAESSKILAADGSVLLALHGEENREKVSLAQMPKMLRDAVVAIEDERFW